MKTRILLVVAALLALGVMSGVQAQGPVARQDARIRAGVRNGTLNRREARRLRTGERRIVQVRRRERISGGRYTARERARVARMERRQSGRIYRTKHDIGHK